MKRSVRWLLVAVVLAAGAAGARGHDGAPHAPPGASAGGAFVDADATGRVAALASPSFPIGLVPRFDLTDQAGRRRTERDFLGRPLAVFFGYASCESICPTALSRLGAAIDLLGADGTRLQPLLITVDPRRDTPETLAAKLPQFHPRLIGLTGSEARLAAARTAFQVEAGQASRDTDGQPIFAHGSFIYLIDADGRLQALLPPILTPERMARIIRKYL